MSFGFEANPQSFYNLSDWGEPVPQRTLRQLGLEGKWAVNPGLWDEHAENAVEHSQDQGPYTEAMAGDGYTAEALWNATPAFLASYASPVAMLWALTHPVA